MLRLSVRRAAVLAAAATATIVLSVLGSPAAEAMCVPGSVTLLPKPRVEPPRCNTHP